MNPHFLALLSALRDAEVRFLLVGAYALAWYGRPRGTGDLDLWVEPSPANAERLIRALAAFGAPLQQVTTADFAQPGVNFQIGLPPVRIDLLTEVTGLDFTSAWERRTAGHFGGLPLDYLGREDFVRNKRAVGRPRDLADIESLETRPAAS